MLCSASSREGFAGFISNQRLAGTMYDCYRKSLLYLKPFIQTSPIPQLRLLPHHSPSPQPQAPTYTTAARTSERESFRMNYLVDSCGFSPETASELSKHASFLNSVKPDAVLKLLRSLDISDSELRDTIKRAPVLLSSDPVNTILPKLEFFKSKGASTSRLAQIVTTNPWLLHKSLENHIIPCYDLMRRFLRSDEMIFSCLKRCPRILTNYYLARNVHLLLDNGVLDSSITLLLRYWPEVFNFHIDEFKTKLDEVKALGFHPSKTIFIEALRTKVIVSTSSWERKVELFGRWGWSDETLLKAFIKRPFCMLISDIKIEAVMDFFVNDMGWDSLVLAQYPILLQYSLEKRIIPRGSVLQFLQYRGLITKNASCTHPFIISEEMFHQKFVNCFKDEASQLLKLYEEKLNLSR